MGELVALGCYMCACEFSGRWSRSSDGDIERDALTVIVSTRRRDLACIGTDRSLILSLQDTCVNDWVVHFSRRLKAGMDLAFGTRNIYLLQTIVQRLRSLLDQKVYNTRQAISDHNHAICRETAKCIDRPFSVPRRAPSLPCAANSMSTKRAKPPAGS